MPTLHQVLKIGDLLKISLGKEFQLKDCRAHYGHHSNIHSPTSGQEAFNLYHANHRLNDQLPHLSSTCEVAGKGNGACPHLEAVPAKSLTEALEELCVFSAMFFQLLSRMHNNRSLKDTTEANFCPFGFRPSCRHESIIPFSSMLTIGFWKRQPRGCIVEA